MRFFSRHLSVFIASLAIVFSLHQASNGARPDIDIPEMPPMRPSVATTGGQRLLINYVPDAEIALDASSGTLSTNRPGWWFINYPLNRIKGFEDMDADEAARVLFDAKRSDVRNWYICFPGDAPTEPEPPTGPAPIDLSPNPALIVDANNPSSSDNNPGTKEQPMKSIGAAFGRAGPGDVIHVYPGTYGALHITKGGTAENPISIEGVRGEDGAMPVIEGRDRIIALMGDFVHIRGFEVRGGGTSHLRGQLQSGAAGAVVEGCLFSGTGGWGIDFDFGAVFRAFKSRYDGAIVVRNNWIPNPGVGGIEAACYNDWIRLDLMNGDANGRVPGVFEYNVTIDPNQANVRQGWHAGGFKLLQRAFCTVRYNTCLGATCHGVWLDWCNYNNRLEGNLMVDSKGYGIATEASPGPNLMANNVVINHHIWDVWFRAGLLSWDSDRNWAINNTIDGKWNSEATWNGQVGPVGINVAPAATGRNVTPFGVLQNTHHCAYNNAVAGCHSAIWVNPRTEFLLDANYTDSGKNAEALGDNIGWRDQDNNDFRLTQSSPLRDAGVENEYTEYVRYDFYGLLRFPEDGRSVGAFRADPEIPEGNVCLEIEYEDGRMERRMIKDAKVLAARDRPGSPSADPRARITSFAPGPLAASRDGVTSLEIHDMRGRLVKAVVADKSGRASLRVPSAGGGAYIVRAFDGSSSRVYRALLR